MDAADQLSTHAELLGVAAIAVLAAVAGLPALMLALLPRIGAVRQNYRGETVPTMFGIAVALGGSILLAIPLFAIPAAHNSASIWMRAAAGFALVGFIDDLCGDRLVKGVGGHVGALVKRRRITTGLIKAVGGLSIGVWLGVTLHPGQPAHAAVVALLVALGANSLNLLDMRPGRAGAVFLFCSALLLIPALIAKNPSPGSLLLVCFFLPALPVWILDSRARVMLGDTGSNLLGAMLGLALAETDKIYLEVGVVVAFILLHIVAERGSLTEIIASNRFLNALDKLTGKRA